MEDKAKRETAPSLLHLHLLFFPAASTPVPTLLSNVKLLHRGKESITDSMEALAHPSLAGCRAGINQSETPKSKNERLPMGTLIVYQSAINIDS